MGYLKGFIYSLRHVYWWCPFRTWLIPHQGHEHRVQVDALLRESVLVALPLPRRLVRDPPQDALVHQRGEPIGEHLTWHPGVTAHVVEAADPVGHLAHDHEGPALPEDRQQMPTKEEIEKDFKNLLEIRQIGPSSRQFVSFS